MRTMRRQLMRHLMRPFDEGNKEAADEAKRGTETLMILLMRPFDEAFNEAFDIANEEAIDEALNGTLP